jgi:3-oxoisoapionate decarboxylase
VRWTRTGEGNVEIGPLMRKYMELCPGKTMSLEIIVTGPRVFGWRNPEFWKGYENVRAAEFARFLGIAAKGKPSPAPAGGPKEQAAERERADFEASLEWTRKYLGV